MFFFERRSNPHYRVKELVEARPGVFGPQYLLVLQRRWLQSTGASGKRWFYEGPVFEITNGKLVVRDYWSHCPEELLRQMHGDQTP